jgi:histidinol-phosphatase (PHP family)
MIFKNFVDMHTHTNNSFDGNYPIEEMCDAAIERGVQVIAFTDHVEMDFFTEKGYDKDAENSYKDILRAKEIYKGRLEVCAGIELAEATYNKQLAEELINSRDYDFVIGSVHYVENVDIYYDMFWTGKTVEQAEKRYFEQILSCVQAHNDIDVLGHLTYVTKAGGNPSHRIVRPEDHRELIDEILRTLASKGKGLEVNTSAFNRYGIWLPEKEYLIRFKELGGEIITVGSDAHNCDRVGEHCAKACAMVADVFGYVCTFVNRKPIFHKL